MGNGLASKMIYYWIFVLGGLTISYLMNFLTEGADFVIMLIVLTLVYWGIEFMRFKKKQRNGQQPAQAGKSKAVSHKKR